MEAEILNEGYENDPRKNIHSIYVKEMIINPFEFTSTIKKDVVMNLPFMGNLTDISLNGYDIYGGSGYNFTTGRKGIPNSALEFVGTGYGMFSKQLSASLYSISFWISFSNGNLQVPFSDGVFSSYGDLCYYYNGSLRFGINNIGDVSYPMEKNSWHHIVLVRNGNTQKMYIDNSLRNTMVYNDYNNISLAILGAQTSSLTRPFNGKISEFTVYSKELSISEISMLFEA